MQLLKVITARSIWLLPVADINPQGKAVSADLIEWMKKTYHFQKYPSSVFDLDSETKALTFLGGKFKSGHEEDGKERYIAVGLSVYTDGLVANTESSTNDSDKFLHEVIDSVVKEFGLVHPGIRKKLYFSEMDVRLDRPLSLINPKLEKFAATISSLRGDANKVAFEFSGVTFFPEPTAQTAISGFALERKLNTEWSENRYYTRAPLQTHAHLNLLEDFESLLSP
jgi:hypothetical protein